MISHGASWLLMILHEFRCCCACSGCKKISDTKRSIVLSQVRKRSAPLSAYRQGSTNLISTSQVCEHGRIRHRVKWRLNTPSMPASSETAQYYFRNTRGCETVGGHKRRTCAGPRHSASHADRGERGAPRGQRAASTAVFAQRGCLKCSQSVRASNFQPTAPHIDHLIRYSSLYRLCL